MGCLKLTYKRNNDTLKVAYSLYRENQKYCTGSYRYGMNGQEKDNEIFEGAYTAEYWEYDSRTGRRWNTDPVVIHAISPYACFNDNPIFNVDIKGNTVNDFFKNKAGDIVWDNSRESSITKNGETFENIGNTISAIVSSFIPGRNSDEGGNDLTIPIPGKDGEKLATYTSITGNYSDDGKFKDFTYKASSRRGKSFGSDLLQGSSDVPGQTNIHYGAMAENGGFGVYNEEHTEVNLKEKFGLKTMGNLVDVNTASYFNISKTGEVSLTISHGSYPSVKASINGIVYYQYAAQSFIYSHAPTMNGGINAIYAATQQALSDKWNSIYRAKNKGVFSGFNAAQNGTWHSTLDW